jgi:tripartite-type tricarboxylate transporter receptor subunit TctC
VIRTSCYLVTALLAYASQSFAQDFPTRFVTIVAPFQAGGPSDTVARLIAVPMSKALGQQVVVENVTGAGGTLGSGRVARAAPDGYTLGISGSGTHAAVEQLYAIRPIVRSIRVGGPRQYDAGRDRRQEGFSAQYITGAGRLPARQRENR